MRKPKYAYLITCTNKSKLNFNVPIEVCFTEKQAKKICKEYNELEKDDYDDLYSNQYNYKQIDIAKDE